MGAQLTDQGIPGIILFSSLISNSSLKHLLPPESPPSTDTSYYVSIKSIIDNGLFDIIYIYNMYLF